MMEINVKSFTWKSHASLKTQYVFDNKWLIIALEKNEFWGNSIYTTVAF